MINKKRILLVIKILFIIFAFYLVFSKIDEKELLMAIKGFDYLYILAAFIVLTIAQVISALRGRYYFITAGFVFNRMYLTALYYVGSLFNMIFPGGIGGDVYKIYLFNKNHSVPNVTSLRLLLSDRCSGLLALLLLTLVVSCFSSINHLNYFYPLIILAAAIIIATYFVAVKLILKESYKVAIGAVPYSFGVQLCSLLIAYLLVAGSHSFTGNLTIYADYITIFMIATFVSVIPISIGGVGLRELTFLYLSPYLGVKAELGVSIAMVYFFISFTNSLIGLYFWHPKKGIRQY